MQPKIREEFLYYIWENKLFRTTKLSIYDEELEILETGQRNVESGPDFINSRIRIGDKIWAGNVEIHIRASDWLKHGHQDDPAYLNVILHVVYINDCRLQRPGGEEVPCLQLEFAPALLEVYENLREASGMIACREHMSEFERIYWNDWYSTLMIERLQEKTQEVEAILRENKYHWEDTLYYFLGKGFGFKINSIPFEMLVRSVPLTILLRFRKNQFATDAILFGQAGFLEDLISEDNYYLQLQKEYHALQKVLPPRVLDRSMWKYKGARPENFPGIRIAQFSSLVADRFPVFAILSGHADLTEWRKILRVSSPSSQKNEAVHPDIPGSVIPVPGLMSIDLLILNSIVPVIFHYASFRRSEGIKDRVIRILEELSPENNVILRKWSKTGVRALNAFESQSLIQLTTRYCQQKRCLECRIGSRIIRSVII